MVLVRLPTRRTCQALPSGADHRRLCQPLMTEDYVIQAMPDVSPLKWHLAHTSWFFETFIWAPPLRAIDRQMPPMRISSIPITWRLVSGIAAPNGSYLHVQPLRRSIAIELMWMSILPFWKVCMARRQCLQLLVVQLGLHHEQQHQVSVLIMCKYNFAAIPCDRGCHPDIPESVPVVGHLSWASS